MEKTAKYYENQWDRLKDDISVKKLIIKELKRQCSDCNDQLNCALRYGFSKNQENMRLLDRIKGLCLKIREVMEDGKNRVHSNK